MVVLFGVEHKPNVDKYQKNQSRTFWGQDRAFSYKVHAVMRAGACEFCQHFTQFRVDRYACSHRRSNLLVCYFHRTPAFAGLR